MHGGHEDFVACELAPRIGNGAGRGFSRLVWAFAEGGHESLQFRLMDKGTQAWMKDAISSSVFVIFAIQKGFQETEQVRSPALDFMLNMDFFFLQTQELSVENWHLTGRGEIIYV